MVFRISGIRGNGNVNMVESSRVIIDALRQKTGSRYQFKCKRLHQFHVSKVAIKFV